jgi:hypothetical protein
MDPYEHCDLAQWPTYRKPGKGHDDRQQARRPCFLTIIEHSPSWDTTDCHGRHSGGSCIRANFLTEVFSFKQIHDPLVQIIQPGMRLTQERLTLIAFLVILDDLRQKPQIVQHSCLGQQ